MPRDQRNINVAAFADWLPVVHGLEHCKQPRMLLHQPSDSIQIARASMRSELPPLRRRGPRSFYRRINIGRRALCYRGELFSVRRIECIEILSGRRRLPFAANKMLETIAMTLQPCDGFFGIFRGGPVFHTHEFFGDAHLEFARFRLSEFKTFLFTCYPERNISLNSRQRMPVLRRIPPSRVMIQLTL